jgi:hypothetical protein
MKTFLRILFTLAFLILVVQSVRHVYQRWLNPTQSVLDRYSPVTKDIERARSLEELARKYDESYNKVKALEAGKTKAQLEEIDKNEEPYYSRDAYRQAIEEWEGKSRQIFEIRFYWFVGLALAVGGFFVFRKSSVWLGITLLLTGFSEIIYWTSPMFFGSSSVEFNRLLVWKMILSAISLILLMVFAYLMGILKNQTEPKP